MISENFGLFDEDEKWEHLDRWWRVSDVGEGLLQ